MSVWEDYTFYGAPGLCDGRSIWLVIVLGLLAYLASPLNPMQRKERQGLLLVYPALIFVYWLLFQVNLLSLTSHSGIYFGPSGTYVWLTNSLICLGAGAIFSIAILRLPGLGERLYGGLFLVLYLVLVVGAVIASKAGLFLYGSTST
jgi:hypothetical protein